MLESSAATFDARKSNVFVFTGDESTLNVINPKAGQIIYVSKSDGNGVLHFAGVSIENGETYSFLYTGKSWSRIK